MATINIRQTKNFTSQFNKLKEEFGEEFAQLNGLGDDQLSYTDFHRRRDRSRYISR